MEKRFTVKAIFCSFNRLPHTPTHTHTQTQSQNSNVLIRKLLLTSYISVPLQKKKNDCMTQIMIKKKHL